MGISRNGGYPIYNPFIDGFPPKKTSILGYPHFRKPPYISPDIPSISVAPVPWFPASKILTVELLRERRVCGHLSHPGAQKQCCSHAEMESVIIGHVKMCCVIIYNVHVYVHIYIYICIWYCIIYIYIHSYIHTCFTLCSYVLINPLKFTLSLSLDVLIRWIWVCPSRFSHVHP